MFDNIIICKNCNNKYGYKLVGIVYPGCKEREYGYCPYCNEIGISEMTSQFIETYKIVENEDIEKV